MWRDILGDHVHGSGLALIAARGGRRRGSRVEANGFKRET